MNDKYQAALNEGRNLTEDSVHFTPALFRQELTAKVVQVLARGRSVLLVGTSGVGKTCVIHEVAVAMRQSGRAKIFEFSVSQLLTGTKYLGEWETKAAAIIEAAVASRIILYFSDLWNLPSAAKSSNRDVTAWDLIRPYVEQGRLKLIGEITPEQLEKVARVPGFASLFEPLTVPPLSNTETLAIVAAEAERMKLQTTPETLGRALDLCRQFLAAADGPGPAKELLAQIRDYQAQKRDVNEPEALTPQFVEKVFSIYSGLPLLVVSPSVTKPVTEIAAWFGERIIGQKEAIRAVVETIALYKAGLHDPARPIGSFLFVGPTGVGKTELARALAKFVFGTESRLLRFDLSEYKDYHAFQLLVGDPEKPSQPARLIDPVRARPFQVVLFDEIEKAHANVWDLLLQVLDEGRLTPPSGKTVSFRNTIVIATSNVGAKDQARVAPGFVARSSESSDRLRHALEAVFRPELLNRFHHIAAFHPLSAEHVRQIGRMELALVLGRQGLAGRKIVLDVAPSVLDLVVKHGYDEHYGARALRRTVQRYVTVPIATLLLERPIDDGSILRLSAAGDGVDIDVVETPETRAHKAEARPIKSRFGRLASRAEIEALLADLKNTRTELSRNVATDVDPTSAAQPPNPSSRQTPEDLLRWARQREVALSLERRMTRLAQEEIELTSWLERAATRDERQRLVSAIERFDADLVTARRELSVMPTGSIADAIVELVALGPNNEHAIELFTVYSGWAKRRGYSMEIICEPLSAAEPITAAIGGHYAYGYLHLESGHHRFRAENASDVVRVRILPWVDRNEEVTLEAQRALKKVGLLGGRVRSRVQIAGSDLVIQNERTLTENGSFAASVAPSYRQPLAGASVEVRRYDRNPFLIKDYVVGTVGRADVLAPDGFHEVLCERIDSTYGTRGST